jgi:hypothetical protein
MKTWPASMSSMKRRCSASSLVQALDPSPKVVALAISMASSMPRGGVGLADQQTAVGPAAHARDLVVLDEPNGFPQHRSADPVTLLQRLLGTQNLPDRPATPNDVSLDAPRDL